jgi:hypothetical protein
MPTARRPPGADRESFNLLGRSDESNQHVVKPAAGTAALTVQQRRALFDDGFIYLRRVVDLGVTREMENDVWSLLADRGVREDDRETWSSDQEWHLQAVRKDDRPPAETPALRVVLDDLFGADCWAQPRDWGQVLFTFPIALPWSPRGGPWHLNHPFSCSSGTITGVNAFLFVADVSEQGGGTLVLRGSPQLVERFVVESDDLADEKMATTQRGFLNSREMLRELTHPSGLDLVRFHGAGFRCRRHLGTRRGAGRSGGRRRRLPSLGTAQPVGERR